MACCQIAGSLGAEGVDVRRPLTIAFVAVALWVAAGIAIIIGAALLFPGTLLDKIWEYNRPAYAAFVTLGRALGVAFIALAILAGSTAKGLFLGRRWAWRLAIGIFAVNGLGDVVALIKTRDLIKSGSGFLLAAVFIGLLLSRSARDSLE
jgi:hypothetical protein